MAEQNFSQSNPVKFEYKIDMGLGQRARLGIIVLRSDQTLVYNYQKTSNKDRIYKAFSFAKELQAL